MTVNAYIDLSSEGGYLSNRVRGEGDVVFRKSQR